MGSVRLAVLVFLLLPMALAGAVLAAKVTTGVLELGSLVGFLTVLGIAGRNGILMVSHFQHLEREEGVPFGPELVLRGAKERLAPILMTASATGLALVPLVVAGTFRATRSSIRSRSRSSAASSPRRCSTCSCCPPCTSLREAAEGGAVRTDRDGCPPDVNEEVDHTRRDRRRPCRGGDPLRRMRSQ